MVGRIDAGRLCVVERKSWQRSWEATYSLDLALQAVTKNTAHGFLFSRDVWWSQYQGLFRIQNPGWVSWAVWPVGITENIFITFDAETCETMIATFIGRSEYCTLFRTGCYGSCKKGSIWQALSRQSELRSCMETPPFLTGGLVCTSNDQHLCKTICTYWKARWTCWNIHAFW